MFTGGYFLTSPLGEGPVFCPERFSDVQKEFGEAAEEFARSEILPRKKDIEAFDKELTLGLLKSCGELGLLGADIPEKYGGLELDKVTSAILAERITKGQSESFMVTFSVQTGIGMLPIVYFGTEEQKEHYLPRLVSGEWVSAYALTEPGSGSDALSIRTTAVLDKSGKFYILNGNKQFISNGGWADVLITFAKIEGEKLTGFLIDPRSEGVSITEEQNKLGLHGSSTASIILENVKVPVANTLGQIGRGADIAFNSLNIGRFKLGAAVLGGCKNALIESAKYALDRRQFGQAIAHFEAIKKKFADMTLRTYALESIVYQTAGVLDESIAAADPASPDYYLDVAVAIEKFAMECSICKVYGSEAMWLNADDGLQVFGGYGFIEDYPLAQVVRDTRVDRIYEGTNEINRQIIVGYLIKKTLMEELPIRERMKAVAPLLEGNLPETGDGPLASEKNRLEIAKLLTLFCFNHAFSRYGQDLLNRQQIGEMLSDMISNLFVLDSSLARIEQTIEGSEHPEELLAVGQVLSAETLQQQCVLARSAICASLENDSLTNALRDLSFFESHLLPRVNTVDPKNLIAELVYRKKDYPF